MTGTTVWGASRAYRWDCLQEILPFEERVAWDGVDEFKANARGWRTMAFEELRSAITGARASATGPGVHDGIRDTPRTTSDIAPGTSSCGRSGTHVASRPRSAMIAGYASAAIRREARSSDERARAYLRSQQSIRALRSRAREAAGHRGPTS